MKRWKPSDSDVEFVVRMISWMADGGAWVIPCSRSIITFNHKNKTFKLDGSKRDETNRRTIVILKMLGYKLA